MIFVVALFAYTIHASILNAENNELRKENNLLAQPSEIELKAENLKNLRAEWGNVQKEIVKCNELNNYKTDILEPKIRKTEKDLLGKK